MLDNIIQLLEDANYIVSLTKENDSLIATFPGRELPPQTIKTVVKYTCVDDGLHIFCNESDENFTVPCPTYSARILAECDIIGLCRAIGYGIEAIKYDDNVEKIIYLLEPQKKDDILFDEKETKLLECIQLCSREGTNKAIEECKKFDVYDGFMAIKNYVERHKEDLT